jgi:hypothetical protein
LRTTWLAVQTRCEADGWSEYERQKERPPLDYEDADRRIAPITHDGLEMLLRISIKQKQKELDEKRKEKETRR